MTGDMLLIGCLVLAWIVSRHMLQREVSRRAVIVRDPFTDRLADCLAECIDRPLLRVRDPGDGRPIELRLGCFDRALAQRASDLLDEVGR